MKTKQCTNGPRHTWEWVKDVTLQTSPRPGYINFSRKGVFKCACGQRKYGQPRSGL